jgi:hypothetical protein
MMNKQELEFFAREAAKGFKTEKDLNAFSRVLTKITVEAALNAELESHLGYSKHDESSFEICRLGTPRQWNRPVIRAPASSSALGVTMKAMCCSLFRQFIQVTGATKKMIKNPNKMPGRAVYVKVFGQPVIIM